MPGLVFETFEVELQNTLYNLYDPAYMPGAHIFQVFRLGAAQGLDALRVRIIAEIEGLRSSTGYPQPTRSDLLYEVLTTRFIQGLSQEKAAEQMGLSARHIRRKQNEAIHALATRVWQAYQAAEAPAQPPRGAIDSPASGEDVSWAELMARELEVLHKNSPALAADAAETLQRVVDLAAYLPDSRQIQLVVALDPAEIKIPVHPAVLQQMLLNLIGQILHAGYQGKARLTYCEDAAATVVCFELCHPLQIDIDPIRTLTAVLGAALDTQQDGELYTIRLVFPKVRRVSVLVVDDNSQVAHLYRRFTANTRYDVSHVDSGVDLLERLQADPADILMIDILLPDIDGWELLQQLRQNAATAGIPVIICSVLGNEQMAHALGAARYLPKPINRRSLLTALDDISADRWQTSPPAQTPES